MSNTEKYNGYKNYVTWNVSLWIMNDEGLYNLAKKCGNYKKLIEVLREVGMIETPDEVSFNDSGIDVAELNEVIEGLF